MPAPTEIWVALGEDNHSARHILGVGHSMYTAIRHADRNEEKHPGDFHTFLVQQWETDSATPKVEYQRVADHIGWKGVWF